MIKLWGRTNSSNVMKVLWLLDEAALAYERVDAGGALGGTATREYRAMSPLGLVPALEDDGFALFESNAILRYLCLAHAPAALFYPAPVRERATVEAWLDFSQTALARPQSAVFHAVVRTPAERRDHAAAAKAVVEAARIWAVLDDRLARLPYVAGERLTIADMALGPHAHRWFAMQIDRPDAPHLRDWYDRLCARPAYTLTCTGPLS